MSRGRRSSVDQHSLTRLSSPRVSSASGPRSQRSWSVSRATSNERTIERLAVNQSAVLGSFYDAATDTIPGVLELDRNLIQTSTANRNIRCDWFPSHRFNSESFLRNIGIDDDVWLRVMFNPDSDQSIPSLIHYVFPTSRDIHFFYYCYTSEKKSISDEQNKVRSKIPKPMPSIAATHVVAAVESGIQVFAVLGWAFDDVANFDPTLDEICQKLSGKTTKKLMKKDSQLLNRISVTRVFSNVSELSGMGTLGEICQSILERKQNTIQQPFISYTLRSIKWFYPLYPTDKANYVPLTSGNAKAIREYLLLLLSKIRKIEHLFREAATNSSDNRFQPQRQELEKRYSDEVDRLRDIVMKMHRGKSQQQTLERIIQDTSEASLSKQMDIALEHLQTVVPTAQRNTASFDERTTFSNTAHISIGRRDDHGNNAQSHVSESGGGRGLGSEHQQQDRRPSTGHSRNSLPSQPKPTYNPSNYTDQGNIRPGIHKLLTGFPRNTPKNRSPRPSDKSGPVRVDPAVQPPMTQSETLRQEESSLDSTKSTVLSEETNALNLSYRTDSGRISPSPETSRDVMRPKTPPIHPSKRETSANIERSLQSLGVTMKPATSSKPSNALIPLQPQTGTQERKSRIDYEPLADLNSTKRSRPSSRARYTDRKQSQSTAEPMRPEPTTYTQNPPKNIPTEPMESDLIVTPVTDQSSVTSQSPPPKKPRTVSPIVTDINILLLGESGVGKSTFINALVNYLAFDSIERARTNPPLIVMPVSFLLTVGHNFEERIVRFGEVDPNEDHNNRGQSVTQQCRSYVFPFENNTHLRFIDTPGMGDTRGLDQDDRNMQHILSFLSHLPHLDAICILLKPNESRLNVVLRSYFRRLLAFLGNDAGENILFCFTNARSTFFAPGNTGPLLRKMLNDLPMKNIAFNKQNTFCFDSESFRYLIAMNNGIEFDRNEEQEYQQSWTKSVAESQRFLQVVRQQSKPYPQARWQSVEHLKFLILQMARPIVESIRHNLRNLILQGLNARSVHLGLKPTHLSTASTICYKCTRVPQQWVDIWILPDEIHSLSDTCQQCSHELKKHIQIYYRLDYEIITENERPSLEEIRVDFNELRDICIDLATFQAREIDRSKEKDPIVSHLKRMIYEEHYICSEKGQDGHNATICDKLIELEIKYEEKWKSSKFTSTPIDLASIYALIHRARKIKSVDQQMESSQRTSQEYMKQYEKQVNYSASS